jgi:hypothetical protein
MKNIEETNRVNRVMTEILKIVSGEIHTYTLSVEGYSVISDSNQNPHTIVEIYIDRIDFIGYTTVIQLFSKEFAGYSVDEFMIPDSTHKTHERFMLILHINKKEGPDVLS